MSIRLKVERCPVISLDDETITLGSDPGCTVPIPTSDGLAPKHAVIRKIAGRWIVELRGGDSLRVGNGDHTRLHWLNPGDVIRLTDDCATITFEPSGMEPESTRASSAPASSAAARPTLRPTPAATSKPTPREPETPQSPKTKSVAVSSFEAAEQQGEIKSLPPASPPASSRRLGPTTGSDSLSTGDDKSEKHRGKGSDPVVGQSPSRSTPKPDSEFEEAPAKLPVLKRMTVSSWSDNPQFTSSHALRLRARRRFWMQVGGAALLAAVVTLIWIAAGPRRTIPSNVDVPDTLDRSIEAPVQPKTPTIPSSITAKPKPEEVTKPSTQKNTNEPTGTAKPRTVTTTPGSPTGSSPKTTVGDNSAENTTPTVATGTPSIAMQATQDGLFAVFAQHSDTEDCFRIGTAWAASRRQLVTSGAVALAVEKLQRQGLKIVVSQPGLDRPIAIKGVRVHLAYKSATEKAEIARQQIEAADSEPASKDKNANGSATLTAELASAYAKQAEFDLGVLDVADGERLKNPLKMDAAEFPEATSTEFVMIGFPFSNDDYRTTSLEISKSPQERLGSRISSAKSESGLELELKLPDDVANDNWSGSPVLNRARRVIGVYSRATTNPKGNATQPRHAIIWLGRLREFAPEFE